MGLDDSITRNAIARYQRNAGHIASGQVDLDIYRSLQHRVADVPTTSVPPPPVSIPLLML